MNKWTRRGFITTGLLVGGGLFFFGSALTGIPLIGAVFGAGAFILLTIGIGPLLVGAIIEAKQNGKAKSIERFEKRLD